MGQLAEAPRDPPITAEKAGTVNLYRSKQTVSCIDYLHVTKSSIITLESHLRGDAR